MDLDQVSLRRLRAQQPARDLTFQLTSYGQITRTQVAYVAILTMGLLLRLPLLTSYHLREDEALYLWWARLSADGQDPLLLSAGLDKPPLLMWLLAGLFWFLEPGEATARLPNLLASLITILLVGQTAACLWDARTGFIASLLYALHPLPISFAATVYTDPLLTLWFSAALWAGARGRWGWMGVAVGLALSTKQQAVLLVPLPLLLAFWCTGSPRGLLQALLGCVLVLAPVTYWDSLRWHVAASWWDLGLQNYGGLGWAPLEAWPERLREWVGLSTYLTLWPFLGVWGVTLLLWPLLGRPDRPAQLLGMWASAYLVAHVALNLQVWDRYLLPVAPVICLWLGNGSRRILQEFQERMSGSSAGASLSPNWRAWQPLLISVLLLFSVAWSAGVAARGGYPLGGDRGAYDGFGAALTHFREHAPVDAILYHHRLGWHYRAYLYDSPHERRWFPHAHYLADNATKAPERDRFVILPDWSHPPDLDMALANRGLIAESLLVTYREDGSRSFTLYQISERSR